MPVIKYLQKRFNAEYVDSITEAGVSRILAEGKNTASIQSILKKLKISIEKHNSVGIAVVAHHDCAGNPALKNVKIIHIKKAIQLIRQQCKNMEIIGLWVDENWKAQEVI